MKRGLFTRILATALSAALIADPVFAAVFQGHSSTPLTVFLPVLFTQQAVNPPVLMERHSFEEHLSAAVLDSVTRAQSGLVVMLFGMQGSGKGTQSALLHEHFGLHPLESSNELKSNPASLAFMDAGVLVPNSIVNQVWEQALSRVRNTPGIILDGFPRTLIQLEWLLDYLQSQGLGIDVIIDLRLPLKTALHRALKIRRRPDDTPFKLRRRLRGFRRETIPAIDYLANSFGDRFLAVDGASGTPQEIFNGQIHPWVTTLLHRRIVAAA